MLGAHVVLGIVIGLVPYLCNNWFYLKDDMEAQFLPMFFHMGRLLRAGEFPLLTLDAWFGSNIIGEFQFAVYNPVSLLLAAVLPSFTDYNLAAAFLACFYYALLAPGCFLLARSFGVASRWSFIAALAITSGNYLSYWGASNWFPLFASCVWLVWAWAFLRRSIASRGDWLLAVVFSYLTISSGFPHTIIILGLVGVLTAVEQWKTSGSPSTAALPVLALGCALLLCAFALLAVVAMGPTSIRKSHVFNNDFLIPNLRDVLQLSSPFHIGFMDIYGGFGRVRTPIFFLAWFLLPLTALLDWSRVNWKQGSFISLGALAAFVLLALQGPQNLGSMRIFLRWLPYLHIAVLLTFCIVATQQPFLVTRRRVLTAAGLIFLTSLISVQVTPGRWEIAGSFALSLVGLFILAGPGRRRPMLQTATLTLVTFAFFVSTHLIYRENKNFGSVGHPAHASSAVKVNADQAPSAYSLFLGLAAYDADPVRMSEYLTGYIFLEAGQQMINGYSGVGHKQLSRLLCMDWNGSTCAEAPGRLFETEPGTGARYVDLFRINRIIAQKGRYLDALLPHLTPEWRQEFDGTFSRRYVRNTPALPATVAWHAPSITLGAAEPATVRHTALSVSNMGNEPAPLVFARLWWPGYHVTLNGTALPLRALSGIFVTVDVPAGASGQVVLSFAPPHLVLSWVVTLLGLAVTCAVLWLHPLLSKRQRLAEPKKGASPESPSRGALPPLQRLW
jgi:hypothetical protein